LEFVPRFYPVLILLWQTGVRKRNLDCPEDNMAQKLALFLAVSITAFILVVVGATITIGTTLVSAAGEPTLDPALVNEIQARETAYRGMIEQANAQLQPATETAPTATPFPTVTPAPYPISPEAAAAIALLVAPNTYLTRPPELVDFQGRVSYEASLNTGLVYIDASTGRVLFNGAYHPVIAGSSSSTGSVSGFSGEREEDD
jgi:hypothetical protein